MAIEPSSQPKRLDHYAGLIKTRRHYRLDVELYEDAIRLSRSFKHNEAYFERAGQRLDVFWKYSLQGRIISVELRLRPGQAELKKYLELQDRDLPLFWSEAPFRYQDLPYVAHTICTTIHSQRLEDKFTGLVNFGHKLANTATRHINNKKTEKIRGSHTIKPLDVLLKEPGIFTKLGTIGSLSVTIPRIEEDTLIFHY
jgi:hypothetical protein